MLDLEQRLSSLDKVFAANSLLVRFRGGGNEVQTVSSPMALATAELTLSAEESGEPRGARKLAGEDNELKHLHEIVWHSNEVSSPVNSKRDHWGERDENKASEEKISKLENMVRSLMQQLVDHGIEPQHSPDLDIAVPMRATQPGSSSLGVNLEQDVSINLTCSHISLSTTPSSSDTGALVQSAQSSTTFEGQNRPSRTMQSPSTGKECQSVQSLSPEVPNRHDRMCQTDMPSPVQSDWEVRFRIHQKDSIIKDLNEQIEEYTRALSIRDRVLSERQADISEKEQELRNVLDMQEQLVKHIKTLERESRELRGSDLPFPPSPSLELRKAANMLSSTLTEQKKDAVPFTPRSAGFFFMTPTFRSTLHPPFHPPLYTIFLAGHTRPP